MEWYSTGIRKFNIAKSRIIAPGSIVNNRNSSTLSLFTDGHDRDLVYFCLSRKVRDRKTKNINKHFKNVYKNFHRDTRYPDWPNVISEDRWNVLLQYAMHGSNDRGNNLS